MKKRATTGWRITAVCILLAVCACACAGCRGTGSVLDYQAHAMTLILSYEAGGIPVTAEAVMAAGGAGRDVRLTILTPSDAFPAAYVREGGVTLAEREGLRIPVSDLTEALSPISLFEIPADARVSEIKRGDTGRTVTLTAGDAVYTLFFPSGATVPATLSREDADGYRKVTVERVVSVT